MALKKNSPALRVGLAGHSYFGVSPDEMDAYSVYTISNPATTALGPLFIASAGSAGTSAATPLVINNKYPDYPRNVNFAIAGSGAGMAGTLTLNGFDQFGSKITEVMSFGTAANGGTVVGTRVFGQFVSGTVNYGTAVGAGTPSIAFANGTACIFGFPVKLGNTTDVVNISMSAGTGPISVGGGTAIGSLIIGGNLSPVHGFRPFATFGGTTFFNVWVKSTYAGDNEGEISRLTQAT